MKQHKQISNELFSLVYTKIYGQLIPKVTERLGNKIWSKISKKCAADLDDLMEEELEII